MSLEEVYEVLRAKYGLPKKAKEGKPKVLTKTQIEDKTRRAERYLNRLYGR